MFHRALAFVFLLLGAAPLGAQEAWREDALPAATPAAVSPDTAWIDLRQHSSAHSRPQSAPAWVESVDYVPSTPQPGAEAKTIFRIRVTRPRPDLQLLMCRLFFDDKPERQPRIIAWDESGSVILNSGPLGSGVDLPSSDTAIVPMIGASSIDIEVPGDGGTVRGVLLDWMISRTIAHAATAQAQDVMPAPFAAAAPLQSTESDTETFGTVTAMLAPEAIRIGASVQTGAAFQFGLESVPLTALLSFEVAAARADAPPEVYFNGEYVGPVSLILPDLADPAYRGEATRLVDGMRFVYTGWVRAQILVPAKALRAGTNDLLVTGGRGTPASAIRATQIQLKYLWDKSDYLLQTDQ